jgi:hypothetical protein
MPKVGEWAKAKCPVCGAGVQFREWPVSERLLGHTYRNSESVEGWRCINGHEVPDHFDPNAENLSNA